MSAAPPLPPAFAATTARAPARTRATQGTFWGVGADKRPAGGTIRGITLGPIESSLHTGRGYGTDASARAMTEARALGANWVSLTVFGRMWDRQSTGISLSFEAPFAGNALAVRRTVEQAHAAGLRVLLVPHLWIESGEWRGEIDPGSDEGWKAFARSYRHFLLTWARVARRSGVDMLAAGVELRSWVTTTRAPSFGEIIHAVRDEYPGPITYAANWDDVVDTVILGELDVIGVNAFYPLADKEGATLEELSRGARKVAREVEELAAQWERPVVFTEFGYTTRADPALRPWEWPDRMKDVAVDQKAQADAYRALLGAMLERKGFAGLFLWRMYADPADMSQEAEWGFSPRGKEAELPLRSAYAASWTADGDATGRALTSREPGVIGLY